MTRYPINFKCPNCGGKELTAHGKIEVDVEVTGIVDGKTHEQHT